MFQFPAFAAARQASRLTHLPCAGLPHSEIRGLTGMCPSPQLIAAYRVLRRLSDPRHPPCALAYFAFVTLPCYQECFARCQAKRATLRFCYPLRQRTCITLVSSDVGVAFLSKATGIVLYQIRNLSDHLANQVGLRGLEPRTSTLSV